MSKAVLLFIISLFMVLGLWPVSLVIADSKTSYDSKGKCATCHGSDGKGKLKVAELLKVDISKLDIVDEETVKKNDVQLAKIVSDGVENSKMKGYKDQFSDKEIKGLVAYIRSLKK